MTTLVVVPCGSKKVWNVQPDAGPTPACDAYVGVPFKVHRRYAERFGDRWLILSAKYGLIAPEFVILNAYNITFKRKSPPPVSAVFVRSQVREQRLVYKTIIALGGNEYVSIVKRAFPEGQVISPFAGMKLGEMLQAEIQAIASGDPLGKGHGQVRGSL